MNHNLDGRSFNLIVLKFMRQHRIRLFGSMQAIGIHRGQPPLLHQLWEDDGCKQAELVHNQFLKPSTVTRILQGMEQAGLVERRPDSKDRRVMRVYLTPAGREIQDAVVQREQQVGEEMLADFTEEEKRQLAGFLLRMRENLLRANQGVPERPTPASRP